MSIVERLFPASELSALGYFDDLNRARHEPPHKKRRLDSAASNQSRRSHDSGYSSDEAEDHKLLHIGQTLLKSRRHTSHDNTTVQPTPLDPLLLQKYLGLMHPDDQARFQRSAPASPTRERTRPSSKPATHPGYSNPGLERGWTAGPRSACSAQLSTRIFDGIRLTSQERSLLHSLMPGNSGPNKESVQKAPESTTARPRDGAFEDDCTEWISSLHNGIVMSTNDAESDDDLEVVITGEAAYVENGYLEKFFDMEEAASQDVSVLSPAL